MWIENRSAIVIRPQQPYADWAESLREEGEPSTSLQQLRRECHVYLVESIEDDLHAEKILKRIHSDIFEEELNGWCIEQKTWPSRRSYKLFKEWFEVVIGSVITDLKSGPILREDE